MLYDFLSRLVDVKQVSNPADLIRVSKVDRFTRSRLRSVDETLSNDTLTLTSEQVKKFAGMWVRGRLLFRVMSNM